MSEERFTKEIIVKDTYSYFQYYDNGRPIYEEDIVDVLNRLHRENLELKVKLDEEALCKSDLNEEGVDLKEENCLLKQALCESMEYAYVDEDEIVKIFDELFDLKYYLWIDECYAKYFDWEKELLERS